MLEPSLERGQRGHQPCPASCIPGFGAGAMARPRRQQREGRRDQLCLPLCLPLCPIPIFSDVSAGISSTAPTEDTLSILIKWKKKYLLYQLLRVLFFILWFGFRAAAAAAALVTGAPRSSSQRLGIHPAAFRDCGEFPALRPPPFAGFEENLTEWGSTEGHFSTKSRFPTATSRLGHPGSVPGKTGNWEGTTALPETS